MGAICAVTVGVVLLVVLASGVADAPPALGQGGGAWELVSDGIDGPGTSTWIDGQATASGGWASNDGCSGAMTGLFTTSWTWEAPPARIEADTPVALRGEVTEGATTYQNGGCLVSVQLIASSEGAISVEQIGGGPSLGLDGTCNDDGCVWKDRSSGFSEVSLTFGAGQHDDTASFSWRLQQAGPQNTYTWKYKWKSTAGDTVVPPTPTQAPAEPLPPQPPAQPTATPTPAPSQTCAISGRVVDAEGVPVPSLQVTLLLDGSAVHAVGTDDRGEYSFDADTQADLESLLATTATEGAAAPVVSVEIALVDAFGHFEVQHGSSTEHAAIELGPIDTDTDQCRIDLDASRMPTDSIAMFGTDDPAAWGPMLRTFRYIHRAMIYAVADLGIDTETMPMLTVVTYCTAATPGLEGRCATLDPVFWAGPTVEFPNGRPAIAIGPDSMGDQNERPTNIEYHEVGHHILAARFDGKLPSAPAGSVVKNHGGLYENSTSTDAFLEGFAEFFATMVHRDLDELDQWWLYWIRSDQMGNAAPANLEVDVKVWDVEGKAEELAFAGLLVDFVDGPDDFKSEQVAPMPLDDWEIVEDKGNHMIRMNMRNPTVSTVSLLFEVTYADGTVHRLLPDQFPLAPGSVAQRTITAPPGVTRRSDIRTITAFSLPAGDDDPLSVSPRELLDALADFPVDDAYPYPRTVADVYASLWFAFNGDRDNNGVDDVDQIFIAHGYFNDTSGGIGNKIWEAGEEAGLSGYAARLGRSEVGRRAPRIPDGLRATFDVVGSTGAPATAHIEIIYGEPLTHLSYQYLSEPDADGRVTVMVPPPDIDAIVRVNAIADGDHALTLATIDPGDYWADITSIGEPFLSYQGTLTASSASAGDSTSPVTTVVIGAVVAALIAVAGAAWLRRPAPPGPNSPDPGSSAQPPPTGPPPPNPISSSPSTPTWWEGASPGAGAAPTAAPDSDPSQEWWTDPGSS